MAGVMDGRRLRFVAMGQDYAVYAWPPSSKGRAVYLGRVRRGWRSTDSKLAGTRLRRPGRGATVWHAEVPTEFHRRQRFEMLSELQGTFNHGWRLEARGQAWDRRGEAAEALIEWHDHPEKRETT